MTKAELIATGLDYEYQEYYPTPEGGMRAVNKFVDISQSGYITENLIRTFENRPARLTYTYPIIPTHYIGNVVILGGAVK